MPFIDFQAVAVFVALVLVILLLLYVLSLADTVKWLESTVELDRLTGLPNEQRFDRDLAVALRAGGQVSVLFVDLDGFGQHNRQGHREGGDTALRSAAATIRRAVRRKTDSVYRLHGDEFAILSYGADSSRAEALGGVVLTHLRTAQLPASCGVAATDRVPRQDLLTQANAAMYRAKDAGRDRVCVAGGER